MMHRRNGAIGMRSTPGPYLENMRHARSHGRRARDRAESALVQVREEDNVILVSGAVPGANGSYVVIRPARKQNRRLRSNLWLRTFLLLKPRSAANIAVVENGHYTQVVHDTVVGYARQSPQRHRSYVKTQGDCQSAPAPSRGAKKARAAPAPATSPRPFGWAAAWSSARIRAITPRRSPRRQEARPAQGAQRADQGGRRFHRRCLRRQRAEDEAIRSRRFGEITEEPKTLVISAAFDENTYLAARNVQPTLLMTAADVNTEHCCLPQDRHHQ